MEPTSLISLLGCIARGTSASLRHASYALASPAWHGCRALRSDDSKRSAIKMCQQRLEELRRKGITDARRVERKDYVKKVLAEDRWFVHCSTVAPAQVRLSGGLDPEKSAELCVTPGGVLIGKARGRLVLAFGCENPDSPVVAGAIKAQGYLGPCVDNVYPNGYLYVFKIPAGYHYYSTCRGDLGARAETAFDYKITLREMRCFHQYNKKANRCVEMMNWKG
jgi:hypothetical protein